MARSSVNGAVMTIDVAELAGLERAEPLARRPRWPRRCVVSAGQGVVGLEPGGDDLAQVGRDGIEPVDAVGGERERDPCLGQDGGRGQLFLPLGLAVGQHAERLVALGDRPSCGTRLGGDLGLLGKVSRSTTGTLYALSRSATLAASRPPTITAVVPNSSARSSARWISSRVFASHQTAQLLGPRGLEGLEGRVERRLRAAVLLVEGVELLEMVGVEHRLAEVGDRAHQHARIGVLAGPGLRRRTAPTALAGRRARLRCRVGRVAAAAGSNGGARLTCSATGAATIASRRGRPLRLTRALWPVAIAPAGAERKSVKPSRRLGSARRVVQVERAGDLELGGQAPAVVGRRRRPGAPRPGRPAGPGRSPTARPRRAGRPSCTGR